MVKSLIKIKKMYQKFLNFKFLVIHANYCLGTYQNYYKSSIKVQQQQQKMKKREGEIFYLLFGYPKLILSGKKF